MRILRARTEAEDVVQEALLHAFLDLAELRDRDRLVAWLLGIVVNLAKTRLRMRREVPVEDWSGGRAIRGLVWMDVEPSRTRDRKPVSSTTACGGPSGNSRPNNGRPSSSTTSMTCGYGRSPRSSGCRLAR
jgi:RNA polymerase sigma-70 factor (ECF subfamily)